jgi:predicted Zn-dependent protease
MAVGFSELSELNLAIYPNSLVEDGEVTCFLGWTPQGKRLCVQAPTGNATLGSFSGSPSARGEQTMSSPQTMQLAALPQRARGADAADWSIDT